MKLVWGVMLALLLSTAAQAQRHDYNSGNNQSGMNSDVVVDMPPEVWTQGQNRSQNPPCLRCCIYENRSYTEGAVVKAEGVLLQCVRDEKSLGTNNLIWRIVK
ncbi:hypothetical protein COO59_03115 [Mixta theicola]|uniref:DUF1496 domain-containing protein n=1 Tax=Mixta theicola TaxID=1458355 RepID=A0A2K1QD09_9GAMM|nr:YnjH family protein [Mixta theicola]PNS12923.1 hypothetical protein COO59_03115 [Mixta theicola]GLR09175.1 hypothetical protein GCM10007905_18950 [Mixta theicola]